MSDIKQVIVMRKDLNMRKGKMCAQAAHASMAFITRRLEDDCCYNPKASRILLSKVEQQWLDRSFVKVVLGCDDEGELHHIEYDAHLAGVECHKILDNGLTEFHGEATWTCLALGPDYADKIDPITGHLRLL